MTGSGADWRDRVQRAPRRHAPLGAPDRADARAGADAAGAAGAADDRTGPHRDHHSECYACPVGSVFAAATDAQPDARAHLLNAIHELIGVARAVLDAADAVVEQQRRGPVRTTDQDATGARGDAHGAHDAPASRIRRIDIG